MPTDAAIESHAERIREEGFTVIEGAASGELVAALKRAIDRIEREHDLGYAKTSFEGYKTIRINNLLAYDDVFWEVPLHANVLPVVERVLDPGCLVSSLSSIAIDPGESAQPIHADDQLMPLPKPHPATVCNTMWALTDFTEENGATRVIPGSHLADHSPEYGAEHDSVPAEMAAGSVLVWHGSLWHGGGANRTDARRTGIAMNYCAGYIRQQENQQLGVPVERARRFEPRLRELCGYGIYMGLIGHIDKRNPADVVLGAHEPSGASGQARPTGMVWDAR